MKTYITKSEKETKDLAKKIAEKISSGVIALNGELGAGKTTFVQGFAEGLGIKDKIISPTFVLIRQHPIANSSSLLFHIDLYRLQNIYDIKQLGLEEIWSNPNNIVIIEWAEKLKKLPKGTVKISIHKDSANKRKFLILNS